MWFLGVVAGLLIGSLMESLAMALLLAGIGGVIGYAYKKPNAGDGHPSTASQADSQHSSSSSESELDELRRKVASLEQRLLVLEGRLAESVFVPEEAAQTTFLSTIPSDLPTAVDVVVMVPEPSSLDTPVADQPTLPPLTLASEINPSDSITSAWPGTSNNNERAYEVNDAAGEPEPAAYPGTSPVFAFSHQVPSESSDEEAEKKKPASASDIRETAAGDSSTSPTTPPSQVLPPFVYAERTQPEPRVPFRDRLPAFARNLIYGGNTLVKMGVLILFLGLSFLLRYTAERITVPIELRYAGVAAVGAGLLGLGWFLRRRRTDYALVMQGMGIGVFYLTTLAAMKFHSLLADEAGFGFMFAVSVIGSALAILQNAPVLAIIAALEGFATPILTSTGGNHMMGLMTYLSILDAGIVLIAWFNAWRILNVIGFVGTFTLASGWADRYYTNEQYAPVQAFLILFFLLFTAVGILFARRTLLDAKQMRPDSADSADSDSTAASLAQQAKATLAQVGRVDSALVFGTPLTAFGLQYVLTKPWGFGPAFSALVLSAFYLVLARIVFSRQRVSLALLAEAYAIMGVIFATLAIPLGFEGVWTGAAWAVEGAGMYWLGVRQNRAYSRAFAYLVLLGASYKLLLSIGVNDSPGLPLLYGSTIGPILLALSAFSVWLQNSRAKPDLIPDWEVIPQRLALWLGVASLTVLPWQWFVPQTAAAATAVMSIIAYFVARRFEVGPLFGIGSSLQVVAVASFLLTLRFMTDTSADAIFDGGLPGTFAALVVAASVLLKAGWNMAATRKEALDEEIPPTWSTAGTLAVIVGTGLLHLAMLFEFSMQTAAAATAALSIVAYVLHRRFDLAPLSTATSFLQGLAVISFLLTLHRATDVEVDAVLDSGWHGMISALIIATSILFTAGWSMSDERKNALEKALSPTWTRANNLALITGTILVHLAMLFAVSLEQAALIWPITSCAVFWVALRIAHTPLANLTAGFQIVSAGLFLYQYRNLGGNTSILGYVGGLPGQAPIESITSFAHLQFWTPIVLSLAAWVCGDRIRSEAKYFADSIAVDSQAGERNSECRPRRWPNPWCAYPRALWLPVVWGLIWWTVAWLDETNRVLEVHTLSEYFPTGMVAITLITSISLAALARWRDWSPMGMMTQLTLPTLALGACLGIADAGTGYQPSAYLGVLVWPLALTWHLRLLSLQRQWASPSTLQSLHIVGFWFFLLLASRECQAHFSTIAAPYSSWSMLGWVLVPALSFWALRSQILEKRWPLSDFRGAYIEIACLPVAAYLLVWCFASNLLSSGDASPLPYLPMLNPLELGQWMVLVALLLWWRALPEASAIRLPSDSLKILAGFMGWFLLTAMVLRTCHQWAGVAWNASALFDSRLAQASLSIMWAIMGMSAMLLGNRRESRAVWIIGATLLAVVVAKLFLVELADRGGLYRIVSFIGVGVLLLIVGYFAPVPVKATPQPDLAEG